MSKSRLKKQTIEYPVGTPRIESYTRRSIIGSTLGIVTLSAVIFIVIGWAIYKAVTFFNH